MIDIKLKIKELQEQSTQISIKMLDADCCEFTNLTEERQCIERQIDALSCLISK